MHWLDLLIIAIVTWLTFRAFAAGLIREVVTLIAVVGGAILAGQFYEDLSADISFITEDLQTRELVAFISIFGGVVVIGQIIAQLLRQTASLLLLGPFDHLGGAAFGFAKGLLVVEVLLLASIAFPVSEAVDTAVDESALAPLFLDHVPVMLQFLPGEFDSAVDGFISGSRPVTTA